MGPVRSRQRRFPARKADFCLVVDGASDASRHLARALVSAEAASAVALGVGRGPVALPQEWSGLTGFCRRAEPTASDGHSTQSQQHER